MTHTENANFDPNTTYIYVCPSSDLENDDLVESEIESNPVVVGRVDGKVYAVDGICSHEYAELIDGDLDEGTLMCPLHFACFDIRDGSVQEGPAENPLNSYEAIESDGSIWIGKGREK